MASDFLGSQKTKWMARTENYIGLLIFPGSVEEVLSISDSSNFCFIQAMETKSINSETNNIYSSARQIWEQKSLKALLLGIMQKYSFNPEACRKLPCNADGRTLTTAQIKFVNKKL